MSNVLVNFISSVGLSIVICIYLSFTVDKTLKYVRNTLGAITRVIKIIINKIEGGNKYNK